MHCRLCQCMIPKSGYRFSEKIMHQDKHVTARCMDLPGWPAYVRSFRSTPMTRLLAALTLSLLVLAPPALAQDRPARAQQKQEERQQQAQGPGVLSLLPADSVTEH